MRTELDKRANQRLKYTATFGGFGNALGSGRKVLLKDVFAGKQLVADHIWVDYEPDLQMVATSLIENKTQLEFYAVAKTYLKDHLFRETGLQHNPEADYSLVEIRQIKIKS